MIYRGHVVTPTRDGWADWPDGRIEVERGRIRAAGPWRRARQYVDLRPHILFPGLVDTHAHVPQLPICGVHPEDLLTWLRKWTFPLEKRFRGERARQLSQRFMQDMLAQGTTTAALYTSAWPDSVDACFAAAEEIGIHAWIGPPLMDEGAYRAVTTKRVIAEARALAALDRPKLRFAVTPRFALSCSEELLEACGDLASARDLPIQTHLAEQPEECREVRRRFGRGYVEVYDRAGLVGPRTIFAHCIWLSAADWRRIAHTAVAHCPTSNVFLRSGVMDWRRAQVARVGFGTDVGAGPDLSIFRVARMAWTVHSLAGHLIDAGDLLRTATLGGGAALGFDDVGSLEAGKSADFIVLDADHVIPAGAPTTESTDDLLSRILHRSGRSSIRQVYVAGRLVAEGDLRA
ncbi:MAG: amidohydrolase family protein [Acidobacteria bacterium]|nr:amidohydrolase family protein [Planctomycetota bacterium]MBE3135234.1 amidohydrolase family protein [Acidobacteriota bacterium]